MNWEVQTMPSKTSFCNGTEFRKCLSRWWPLWVIYGVILFILLPGVLLNARTTTPYVSTEQIGYLSNVILSETQMLLPLTAFCAGLLAAAAMFGYLYTPRSAGLAASLYLRGIPCVQLPTSLLSVVDSSVGGKTAVDLPEGKNLVGTFTQPHLVLCDTNVLATLSPQVEAEGWAEII